MACVALFHALTNPKGLCLCIAPSERQANHIYTKIRAGLRHPMLRNLVIRETATEILLSNGARIVVLPGGNPKTVTGFSPTLLIIDEAAELKEDTFTEILPSLRFTKGRLIMISTPHGKTGRFYQTFHDNDFSKYHVTSIECKVNTPEEIEKDRLRMTEMEFQRMVMGEFVEAMDAYFPRSLVIDNVQDIVQRETPQVSGRDYYLGVDVARYGTDESAYVIVEADRGGMMHVVRIMSTSKKPLTDVIGRVEALHSTWGFRGIYIDASGIGAGAVDVLKKKGLPLKNLSNFYGASQTGAGVPFTLQNKEQLYKNLKLQMETGRLKYPNHEKLIRQLSDMLYEYTEGGHLKIHHPENGHDDFPDALALACAFSLRSGYRPYIAT